MQESSEESASQNEGDARGEARLTEPTFKAYGSGAPKWLGLLIFLAFFAAAVAALAPQVIHPTPLQGFALFITVTTNNFIFVLAPVVAFPVWRLVTWRLRSRYPDKLLVSADHAGIGLPSGYVIPYVNIRRIYP